MLRFSKNLPWTVSPPTGNKPALSASDFAYLGSYRVSGNVGDGIAYGAPLAVRYVDGQLRFLVVAYASGNYNLVEFAPPSTFGQTVLAQTNRWPGGSVWKFRPAPALIGHHYGLWAEDLGNGDVRLWQSFGVDYPGPSGGVNYQNMTLGVACCTLNADNTLSDFRGPWGFQGVSQRCVMGHVQNTPTWMQAQYGVGPRLFGFGGYASLMNQSGTVSLGLFALAGPDVVSLPPATAYPPAGYSGDGSDFTVPSSAFKVLADHRSGVTQQDYAPATGDRGVRLNPVTNYYDSGQDTRTPSDSNGFVNATFIQGSAAVTFASPQTLNQGDWIASFVGDGKQYIVAASVINSTIASLTTPYGSSTVTGPFHVSVSPPAPPVPGAHWLSPGADGKNRWVWGDNYFGTPVVIDGPNKQGLVAPFSGAGGKCWYNTPGNFLTSDSGISELHIYDLNDLGKVAQGALNPWAVQPSSMLDVTPTLRALGIGTLGHDAEPNGPTGGAYDSTTGILWVFSPGIDQAFGSGGYDCLLSAWQVSN